MLLTVDIGNSRTKFAVFHGDKLASKFSVNTDVDDLVGAIDGRLDDDFDSAVVCSVVPEAADRLGRLLEHGFGVKPIWVDSETDVGLEVKHTPRKTLGTDRLVNSFAGAEKYGTPVIVCSFGTATTIDFVNGDREMVGGLIAPGMELMAKALHAHTAKLPQIDMTVPSELLGTSTVDAIMAGVYLSVIGLLETAVSNIRDTFGDARVVATGGSSSDVAASTSVIDVIDQDLMFEGLRLIARRLNA